MPRLIACAWILWGMFGRGVHYFPIQSFLESQYPSCQKMALGLEHDRDVAVEKATDKETERKRWADSYICLPDTINPIIGNRK